MQAADIDALVDLALALWPDHSREEMAGELAPLLAAKDAAFFGWQEGGRWEAFAQCQLRHDYVEGTETSPVGYLEGVYVKETDRRQGIARELAAACENWAGKQGCSEFASDCELTNTASQAFHQAIGFEEANRIVAYTRKIRRNDENNEQ